MEEVIKKMVALFSPHFPSTNLHFPPLKRHPTKMTICKKANGIENRRNERKGKKERNERGTECPLHVHQEHQHPNPFQFNPIHFNYSFKQASNSPSSHEAHSTPSSISINTVQHRHFLVAFNKTVGPCYSYICEEEVNGHRHSSVGGIIQLSYLHLQYHHSWLVNIP
jgi:hypothetical protein